MFAENRDIRTLEKINEIVACIDKETYGYIPNDLISFFETLPHDRLHDYLRTICVPYLFHCFTDLVESDKDPIEGYKTALKELENRTRKILANGNFTALFQFSEEGQKEIDFDKTIAAYTGQHYGSLFKQFDHDSYFVEAQNLLHSRLEMNNIVIAGLSEAKVLDQGCGGGRYTVAWKLLGARQCVGLDISEIGIADAQKRMIEANISDVSYVHGSVLDMPFEDNSFDIVYSNGVLHHSDNWEQGIAEQMRVMKKGSFGWNYLIEDPGGIFWDNIEILRAIMRKVNKTFAQNIMNILGIPSNRIFYMLDHVMVPVNTRISPEEFETTLAKYGATKIQRLNRGANFDRIEYIYNKIPFAFEKFGVGENRYVFSK